MLGDPTLINVGCLTWQKGQWHLIRSFKEVVKELKEAKLLIVGGGSLERKLLTFVEKLGLKGKVIILGARLNPFKFLARSDLFCFPSLREGLPTVRLRPCVQRLDHITAPAPQHTSS